MRIVIRRFQTDLIWICNLPVVPLDPLDIARSAQGTFRLLLEPAVNAFRVEHMSLLLNLLLGLLDVVWRLHLFPLRHIFLGDIGLGSSFVDLLASKHFQLLAVLEGHQADVAVILKLL